MNGGVCLTQYYCTRIGKVYCDRMHCNLYGKPCKILLERSFSGAISAWEVYLGKCLIY